jgi:hypothetical protein
MGFLLILVSKLGGNWDLVFGKTGDENLKSRDKNSTQGKKEKRGPNWFSHLN